MALAAATLSNHGDLPVARLVTAFETAQSSWVMAPASSPPVQALPSTDADEAASALAVPDEHIWQVVASGNESVTNPAFSWYLGGTLPDWQGVPLALAVLLEGNSPSKAQEIGQLLLHTATNP